MYCSAAVRWRSKLRPSSSFVASTLFPPPCIGANRGVRPTVRLGTVVQTSGQLFQAQRNRLRSDAILNFAHLLRLSHRRNFVSPDAIQVYVKVLLPHFSHFTIRRQGTYYLPFLSRHILNPGTKHCGMR